MQVSVKFGVALLAAAVSGSVLAVQPVGTSAQGASGPDVAKTPTPTAPVPIPYPNLAPQPSAQQETGLKNNSTFRHSTGDEASSGVVQYYNPKELTVDKRVPAAGPLPLTPLDRPVAREPGKVEIPNVQAVRPVPPPPAAGWPAKIQGPTMVDIAGDKRRAPAKIDAITK